MYVAYFILLMLTSGLGGHLCAKAYPPYEYRSSAPMLIAVAAFLVLLNVTIYLARATA